MDFAEGTALLPAAFWRRRLRKSWIRAYVWLDGPAALAFFGLVGVMPVTTLGVATA